MADIALVSLALDSSGVVAGEKQATRSLQNITASADKTTQTLQNMGGPIGRLASSFGNLTSSTSGLVGGLGLLGGASAVAVTAITALSGAFIKAALDGAKLADEIVTISQITGVSVATIEELETGYVGLGGSAQDARGAISRFSNLLGQAATGEVPQLTKALKALGVTDFTDLEGSLRKVRTTLVQNKNAIETNALATQLVGKEGARLVEVWKNLDDKSSSLNQNMERFGLKLGAGVVEGAAAANNALGLLQLKFDQIKKQIAFELSDAIATFGETFITTLKNLEPVILATARLINALAEPLRAGIPARPRAPGAGLSSLKVGGQDVFFDPTKFPAGFGPGAGGAAGGDAVSQALKALLEDVKKTPAAKAAKAAAEPPADPALLDFIRKLNAERAAERVTYDQLDDAIRTADRDVEDLRATIRLLPGGLKDSNAAIDQFLQRLAELQALEARRREFEAKGGVFALPVPIQPDRPVNLVIPPGSPIQAGRLGGEPLPGAGGVTLLPSPEDLGLRSAKQEALDKQFEAIFDDFLISILTAQKTVGAAFGDLALGVVDQFAIEFTTAFRKSFITPVIRGLTDMLQEGIESLFGGITAGGTGKFFKGAAKFFAGLFAEGGTIAPGMFGIVGERGPEIAFSGASPLHVAPMATNTSGMNFTLIQNIHAPEGSVSKRTQDQMANSVLVAVERANRNRGAR